MRPTNLLFIYTDEQASSTLEAYGNSRIYMPNLNRLAQQSVVFDRAYVTQPVCTPSRSTLLTGLYPHTNACTENNVPLSPETQCLPEMITNSDYVTAHYGKWHLGDELHAQHGFRDWIGIEDGYNGWFTEGKDRDIRSAYYHFLIENGLTPKHGTHFSRGEAARLPEEYGKPAFLAGEASRFLRENQGNPFILYVNFLEPHMPFFGPRDEQYDVDAIPLPPNFDAAPTEAQPLKARLLQQHYLRHGHSGLPLANRDEWRRMIANYWGLCSLIDTHIGTILDTLDDCGLSDSTIVVFTSDHGDMMGAHQLLAKCLMFEEAVRVPLLMRLPGQTQARRVVGPVSQIDVVPTLLDLMGKMIPEHLQGKSLRPWMENPTMAHDDPVFIEWNGPNNGLGDVQGEVQIPGWMTEMAPTEQIKAACSDPVRSVITADNWKFNCSPRGEHELYHLEQDPGETQNLFGRGECAPIAGRLRGRIDEWQARTADLVELPPIGP